MGWLVQCVSLEELPKRDDLTERHTLSFFSSFSRSGCVCYSARAPRFATCKGGKRGDRLCCKSLWDTFFSYSYTLVMDVLADNQANNNPQTAAQNNNSDYMGLALKQWSVYLGNVLLNFIHKECKNGHMSSPTQIQQSQMQHHQFYKNNNFCPCCHYNYHHNNGYYNYAHFLGSSSQRQYVRKY